MFGFHAHILKVKIKKDKALRKVVPVMCVSDLEQH